MNIDILRRMIKKSFVVILLIIIASCASESDEKDAAQGSIQLPLDIPTATNMPWTKDPCAIGDMVTKKVNGVNVFIFERPGLKTMKVEVGLIVEKEDNIEIEEILFDDKNIWQPQGIIDQHPIPAEVVIRWYRPGEKAHFKASTRLQSSTVAVLFCPDSYGGEPPILTIVIQRNNQVKILRTFDSDIPTALLSLLRMSDFDLSDGLLVFKEITAIRVPENDNAVQ